jgi:hypothetical protein
MPACIASSSGVGRYGRPVRNARSTCSALATAARSVAVAALFPGSTARSWTPSQFARPPVGAVPRRSIMSPF